MFEITLALKFSDEAPEKVSAAAECFLVDYSWELQGMRR
jgi:hypothetical protein